MSKSFAFFGRGNKKPVVFSNTKRLRVLFHRDARGLQTHGALVVSHPDYDLENNPIRFNFLGLSTPPVLTIDVFQHLVEEAEAQGYVVHHLLSYGTVIDPNPAREVSDVIQKAALSSSHAVGTITPLAAPPSPQLADASNVAGTIS